MVYCTNENSDFVRTNTKFSIQKMGKQEHRYDIYDQTTNKNLQQR